MNHTTALEKVKKNFGFGCMRLPLLENKEVDTAAFCEMVDAFMASGFNYFDTARGYLGGRSETALRDCLVARYNREDFVLTNKLSESYFEKEEDIIPYFESQLEACGVEYFDFYLMHAQASDNYDKYMRTNAYEVAKALKKQGKIKHLGISFHDSAKMLEMILNDHPEIEVVQIQFNYVDYEDSAVQSRACYEVCRKYNKPIIVMEPVKGGNLVNLPDAAKEVFARLGGSAASYAIRFAASFEGIFMVLSGMGNMEMLNENVGFMKEFSPLDDKEMAAIDEVREIFAAQNLISCTSCRYCTAGCPKNIPIPDLFSCYNDKKRWGGWNSAYYYDMHTQNGGKASECIGCGKCEKICPQHLEIRKLLTDVAKEFEKKKN